MTYEFRPLKRERIPLLIGVAGGTGSGKTMSALRLARGLAAGEPFAGIDTENGRMSHYAELFPECQAANISAPFRPAKYAEAIEAADAAGFPVVVVDSASHEWYGDGGCLDWHDELMGGDQKKNLSAWIEPKKEHKRMVTRLLQLNAHVILCFRAEPKVEAVRRNGRTEIVPKASLTGLDGWIPIAEKNLPYELTASFLLMADAPGLPKPIKLQEQHKPFVKLDAPLDEDTGRRLAEWARGNADSQPVNEPSVVFADKDQRKAIFDLAKRFGLDEAGLKAVLATETGQESTARVPADRVPAVLEAVAAAGTAPKQPDGEQFSLAEMLPGSVRDVS
jgi:hypothetical protein